MPTNSNLTPTGQPYDVSIEHLSGTGKRLAHLVLAHADYEFEGFYWLKATWEGIAVHLGVSEKTIRRCVEASPFYHLVRKTAEDGRHILLKLGRQPCESDLVFKSRGVWKRGLAYFNDAALRAWPVELSMAEAAGSPHGRLGRISLRFPWPTCRS